MESFSIEKLTSFIKEKGFFIRDIYSVKGSCSYIKIIYEYTGDEIVLDIPSKYPMKSSKGIEIVEFTDTEDYPTSSKKESYGDTITGMEDEKLYLDPKEADRILEQYQSIDIDQEKSEILKSNIVSYKKQLERLKTCTNSIKYKLCIISSCSICCVSRVNEVKCFVVKRCNPSPNEERDFYVSVDLENFYDKIDSIINDVNRVYKKLYEIMENVHKKQTDIISFRLKQYEKVYPRLSDRYKKKEEFEDSISSLKNILERISKKEREIKKEINLQKPGDIDGLFTRKKTEEDYNKLLLFREETVTTLTLLRKEYNNFMLEFDKALFDTVRMFNDITSNFTRIKVLN